MFGFRPLSSSRRRHAAAARHKVSSGSLTVLAQPGLGVSDGRVSGPRELMLTDIHRVDYGTFGTIYRAFLLNGKKVAIKKVLQHSNYRVNRDTHRSIIESV